MPKELPMKMSTAEIKNAMMHPDLIKHLYGVNISDQWGEVNGRQILIDVGKLCDKHEELLKELAFYKNKE